MGQGDTLVLGRSDNRRPGLARARRGALWAVLAVLMAISVVFAAIRLTSTPSPPVFAAPPVATTVAPPAPVALSAALQPVGAAAPAPAPVAVAAALSPLAAVPAAGALTGQVTDGLTGAVLWDSGAQVPQVPASSLKILTAAAALLTLPLDARVSTRVVSTGVAGQVALVGGGDPTLSAQPAGVRTYYPGAPRLDDLVAQVRSTGVPVTSVVVDSSRWSGPLLAPGWVSADIAAGYSAPAEALMLDGARLQPLVEDSPRSPTPALDAGRVFAQRLGLDPAAVTAGVAPSGTRELATVTSAALSTRGQAILPASDNVAAEALGREVALARGTAPTFGGTATAITEVLGKYGFDVSGLVLNDASGLSTADRVPARLLSQVLTAAAGNGPQSTALRPLVSWLPVAGATGTLADRFTPGMATRGAAGWVRAKTGTLSGVSSLAGVVTDTDGRVLVFVLMSTGASPADTRPALDAIAAKLRSCGCR